MGPALRPAVLRAAGACALLLLGACATTPSAPFTSARIAVTVVGAGPDVILIPGPFAQARTWTDGVQALPGYRYHLVRLTDDAGGDGPVAAPAAEEIARYVGTGGLSRPAVIGQGLGGAVGLMLASRHPNAVSRLMVVDMVPALGALFSEHDPAHESVQEIAARYSQGVASSAVPGRAAPGLGARGFRELLLTDLGPGLARIGVPVTVAHGGIKGWSLGDAESEAIYRSAFAPLRQAVFVRLAGPPRFLMWDQPPAFAAEAKAFLDAK